MSDKTGISASRPYLWAIAGALALMIFAAVNSYALFFTDTRAYVRGGGLAAELVARTDLLTEWKANEAPSPAIAPLRLFPAPPAAEQPAMQNNGITANRSIYYGIIAFLGYYLTDFWLTIFVQAYCVAALVALLFLRAFSLPSLTLYLVVLAALSVLTPAGPFVAFMMPDIFAAAMILGAALLLGFWRRLSWLDRGFAIAMVAYSVLAHTSHAVVLLGMMALTALAGWFFVNLRASRGAYMALAACIATGIAGQMAFNTALTRMTGSKPLMLPHITAHLVDMGPGYAYLKQECPQAGFAVCEFLPILPVYWEDFLGNPAPGQGVFAVADLATKRRLSDEQIPFAIAVFRHDPVGLTTGLAYDAITQLGRFSLANFKVEPKVLAYYESRFPPHVVARIKSSLVGRGDWALNALTASTWVLVLIALGLLGRDLSPRRRGAMALDQVRAIIVVAIGIFANGTLCAILASPYDRFQSRVIWLLPLMAAVVCATRYHTRHRTADAPGGEENSKLISDSSRAKQLKEDARVN